MAFFRDDITFSAMRIEPFGRDYNTFAMVEFSVLRKRIVRRIYKVGEIKSFCLGRKSGV